LSSAAAARAALLALGITDDYLAQRGLRLYDEARELVRADTGADGREFLLTPPAAQAWRAMQSAAAADGITLVLESAYRSVARQVEILQAKLAAGQALDDVLLLVAPPGCSEHHTGCAVDIGTPGSVALREEFETTAAFTWLQGQAASHGFVMSFPRGNVQGYSYEPWHWCFQRPLPSGGAHPATRHCT
jgi:D-alanyl-D-alanine carboxypeptidase